MGARNRQGLVKSSWDWERPTRADVLHPIAGKGLAVEAILYSKMVLAQKFPLLRRKSSG